MGTKLSNLLQEFYRHLILLKYCLEGFLCYPNRGSNTDQYYFFANGMHFQEKSNSGLIIDKAEYWLHILDSKNVKGSIVLNPFAVRPRGKISRNLIRLEKLVFLNLLRAFRLYPQSWFIDKCDPNFYIDRTLSNRLIVETYHQFLKKKSVKLILGIGLNLKLVLVAKSHGIKTIEFQHGVGAKDEFVNYGKFDTLPDLIFTWDKHFSGKSRDEFVRTLGYPKDFSSMIKSEEVQTSRNRILVTLSYGDRDSVDPAGMLNRLLYECISTLVANRFIVTIRPHPAALTGLEVSFQDKIFFRKFVPWFKANPISSNTTIDINSPLFELLMQNNFHLTFCSSVALEAAYLKVPSLLLCERDQTPNFPEELIESGIIKFTNPENLIKDLSAVSLNLKRFPNVLDEGLFIDTIFEIVPNYKER